MGLFFYGRQNEAKCWLAMAYSHREIAEFYRNVAVGKENEHWHWQGETKDGVAWWKGRPAAYTAWEIRHGLSRMKTELIQACGDGLCVNPTHLKDSGKKLSVATAKKAGYVVVESDVKKQNEANEA